VRSAASDPFVIVTNTVKGAIEADSQKPLASFDCSIAAVKMRSMPMRNCHDRRHFLAVGSSTRAPIDWVYFLPSLKMCPPRRLADDELALAVFLWAALASITLRMSALRSN